MLDEIRSTFAKFEQATEHPRKIEHFRRALGKINSFSNTKPKPAEKEIVKNIKLTYTRKLLEQIDPDSGMEFPDDNWADYLKILLIDCKPEVERLTADHPRLLHNLEIFKESVKEDLNTLIDLLEQ
ncbi:MAG: hypothetical protein E4H13_11880 [Calditrichales bacterium]|nr:MAG: hypothetical protein E4H13_11880 [Calditrichales bacterium]